MYEKFIKDKPYYFLYQLKKEFIGLEMILRINYDVSDVIGGNVSIIEKDSELGFKIGDIEYSQDKMHGFHIFKLIKDDDIYKYINIIIDPSDITYPNNLFLRISDFTIDVYNWQDVLDSFINRVHEYYS